MSDPGKKRTLSAILFADIQGYTAVMQADESKALNYLSHYQNSLQENVKRNKGEVFKNYGDGSLCLFGSVLDAVLCARDLQLSLQQDPKVPLRIGLHMGDVTFVDNDIYGDAINIASRIESLGTAGNVLMSKDVFDRIKNQSDLKTKSIGAFNFKNVSQPIEVYALSNVGMVVPKKSELDGKLKLGKKNFISSFSNLASILVGLFIIVGAAWYFLGGNKKQADVAKMLESSFDQSAKSIAVLSFKDLSASQDQEYFSEGISEEILNLLTKIPELKVISRTSSFAFKNKETSTQEIGSLLRVNHLLDGSIRKAGNDLRISAQLIEAQSGTQLWSENYDRKLDDIFKIQDEIAAEIIEELEVSLMGKSLSSKTVNIEAYNLYLEARLLRDQRNFESDSIAEQLIRESIAIDSLYAPSWAMLSELVYNGGYSYSRYNIPEALPISISAAKKAIELDPNNSIGYIALTTLNRAENDFVSANKNLKRALEIDPENTDVIYESASYELDLGNMEASINYLNQAIELDPINYLLYYTLGLHLMWIEDYEGAEKAMAKYLRVFPNSGLANNFMSQIYISQGKKDKALRAIEKDTDPYWSLYRKSILAYATQEKAKSDDYLNTFITDYGDEGWPNIAHIYAYRGEKDAAFKWLELAYQNEDASLFEILNYPEFKILYKDPRWNQFIKKLNLPANEGFSNR